MPQLPDALAWQAVNALTTAGVVVVRADGQPFDPALHHVAGVEPSPDPRLVDTVARTVRPGYVDQGQVVVHPKVVIYGDASPSRTEVAP